MKVLQHGCVRQTHSVRAERPVEARQSAVTWDTRQALTPEISIFKAWLISLRFSPASVSCAHFLRMPCDTCTHIDVLALQSYCHHLFVFNRKAVLTLFHFHPAAAAPLLDMRSLTFMIWKTAPSWSRSHCVLNFYNTWYALTHDEVFRKSGHLFQWLQTNLKSQCLGGTLGMSCTGQLHFGLFKENWNKIRLLCICSDLCPGIMQMTTQLIKHVWFQISGSTKFLLFCICRLMLNWPKVSIRYLLMLRYVSDLEYYTKYCLICI